ncbi:MAG: site-2 protease family protein [Chloroflexota bacterium]
MLNIGPEQLILIGFFLLVGFPIHEFAHALAAWWLGDGTAKLFGRLTLNPVAHFDPLGGIVLVISVLFGGLIIGWAKPTPVNPANLRDRRNGEVIVALAGPASNLIMALAGALALRLLLPAEASVPPRLLVLLFDFVLFNVMLGIFNLIPIPPLDGSTLLFRFVSPQTAWRLRPVLAQYGFLILLMVILLGGQLIGRLVVDATRVLVGV